MLSRVVSVPLTSTAVPDAGGIVSDPTDELAEKAKSSNPNAHCCGWLGQTSRGDTGLVSTLTKT